MNKFFRMPGTDDLINVNHIVSISKVKDDEYLVVLTSGSYTLNFDEYLSLSKLIYHSSLIY